MSGMSRCPSAGTPAPTCHEGLGNILLAPPPLAESDPPLEISVAVSFQVTSGMYEIAEPLLLLLEVFQNVAEPSFKVLPPTAVTLGELGGKSTANPCLAVVTALVLVGKSQSAAPL